MGHKNDAALLIRKAAQFAAGFGFAQGDPGGIATAGTAAQISPTLGARVRGGFSAISPAFQEFEESRANVERLESLSGLRRGQTALTSAEFNRLQDETRRAKERETRENEPVFLDSITGGLGKRNQEAIRDRLRSEGLLREEGGREFVRRGGLQGRKDKFFDEPDEKIEVANNEILDAKDRKADLELTRAKEIEKLINERKKLQEAGQSFGESIEDFRKRLEGSHPLTTEIQGIEQNVKNALAEIEIQRDILRRAAKPGLVPVAQQKLAVLQSPEFQSDLQEALDLEERIRRGEKVVVKDKDGKDVAVTIEDIINFMENQYPIIGNDIRGFLRTPKKAAGKTDKRAEQRALAEGALKFSLGKQ